MATTSVSVQGLKELGQAMNVLERKVKNRLAVKAMRRGAAIVREQARSNAPVLNKVTPRRKAGTLKKAISARTKIGRNGQVNSFIWVKGLSTKQISNYKGKTGKSGANNPRDPYYWRFVEFGTSKMPAKPFLRPAFKQSKEKAAKEIIQTLATDIVKEGNQ